jgi:cephalosporin-C deacetylase-like acetyl esterase
MADLTKIQGFDLFQETYKYVGDHAIRADILVPQTNYTGKRPAIARFHGGGLVCTHNTQILHSIETILPGVLT